MSDKNKDVNKLEAYKDAISVRRKDLQDQSNNINKEITKSGYILAFDSALIIYSLENLDLNFFESRTFFLINLIGLILALYNLVSQKVPSHTSFQNLFNKKEVSFDQYLKSNYATLEIQYEKTTEVLKVRTLLTKLSIILITLSLIPLLLLKIYH